MDQALWVDLEYVEYPEVAKEKKLESELERFLSFLNCVVLWPRRDYHRLSELLGPADLRIHVLKDLVYYQEECLEGLSWNGRVDGVPSGGCSRVWGML